MDRTQIIKALSELARSQGFYGRFLASLNEMSEDDREETLMILEEQHFKDVIDLVLFLEG